jgi:Protein of unknown function (DUF3551)
MLRAVMIAIVLAAGATVLSQSSANAARWCAYYYYGATNCGFHSYGQCLAAISGVGGVCRRG